MIEEYTIFNFISDVGAPIAAAVFMGAFIFVIIKKIMDDVVGDTEEVKGISRAENFVEDGTIDARRD